MSFLYKGLKTHDARGNYWNVLRTWVLIKAMIYAKSIECHGFMAAIIFCQPCLSRQKFTLPRARCLTIPIPRVPPYFQRIIVKQKILCSRKNRPFFVTEKLKRFYFFRNTLRWIFSGSKDRKC